MFRPYLDRLEKKITARSSEQYTPSFFSFEMLLVLISMIYGWLVRCRLVLYRLKVLKQKTLPCFVVSIGNIVVGGTGKTPMTLFIAELLVKLHKKVVVVSRGYKGTYSEEALVVSDGYQTFCSSETCGDEPFLLAEKGKFPVVVGKNRYKAGQLAINVFSPDVILLDDGHQHLQLKKNLDLLLFDYKNPLGNSRLLPAGRLRQTPSMSYQQADGLIFTRKPEINQNTNLKNIPCVEETRQLLNHYSDIPHFNSFHHPLIVHQHHPGTNADSAKAAFPISHVNDLKGRSAVLFSGIAVNKSFYKAMDQLEVCIISHLEFNDHHRYKKDDILMVNQEAVISNADLIITTYKDWIKIDQSSNWEKRVVVIDVEIALEDPEQFTAFLLSQGKLT